MHLTADPATDPAGVPAGLGGVDGGRQGHVVELGQCDGGICHQPVVGVYHVGDPALAVQLQPGADHAVPHGQNPGHHVGAEVVLVRILRGGDDPHTLAHGVGGGVARRIGAGRLTGQHHDIVTLGGQRGGQLIDVPAEPADHHRRVLPRDHQDLHARLTSAVAWRPGRRTDRRRRSIRWQAVRRFRDARRPAHRRSHGWRGRADEPGSGRSRRRNPWTP